MYVRWWSSESGLGQVTSGIVQGAVVYSFRESTLKLASLQSIAAARAPRATVRKVE